jgi:hypothetical protein
MRTATLWIVTVALVSGGMVALAEARSKEQFRGRYQLQLGQSRELLKRTAEPTSGPKNVSGSARSTTGSKK